MRNIVRVATCLVQRMEQGGCGGVSWRGGISPGAERKGQQDEWEQAEVLFLDSEVLL